MNNSKNIRLAYLDHNVLDLMTKGDPHNVKHLIKENNLSPAYSTETLNEIERSKGYEDNFLELLEEISAQLIELELDKKFKYTGKAFLKEINPNQAYREHLANKYEIQCGDFGLSDMLLKFYGGNSDKTFEQIFNDQGNELQKHLQSIVDDIDNEGCTSEEQSVIEKLKELITTLPDLLNEQTNVAVEQLDNLDSSPIASFEQETGISPKVLNNIQSPNVVKQIWDLVSLTPNFPDVDIDTFFGIKAHEFEEDSDRERTQIEKVNGIYHQLNFLGYYRDSNMRTQRRFIASFSDMTHAGIASLCHFFLCRDNDLVLKAAAAYEYLNIPTQIIHYQHSSKAK